MDEGRIGKATLNKYEYLRSDIKPIMASIGSTASHIHSEPEDLKLDYIDLYNNKTKDAEYINWGASQEKLYKEGFKNVGRGTYVISKINPKNKYSLHYANCTGLIVCGEGKEDRKNISFLSHQIPTVLHNEYTKAIFIKDLEDSLDEIKENSTNKTIDAVLLGGNYIMDPSPANNNYYARLKKNYIESIKLLREIVFKKLGFYPNVALGPKITRGQDDVVYFDNEKRRVFIGRESMREVPATLDYNSADLENSEKNNWEFPVKKK